MKFSFNFFGFLFFALGVVNPVNAQLLFQERASILGCDDSTYGSGLLGGGISFYDFDNDGWDDITLSTEEGQAVKFFKNVSGSFIEIDFNLQDPLYETKTVQWVDYDNDGDNDLFVTSNIDENRLYKNDGAMQFIDITESSGLLTSDHRSFGASWGDIDNDGLLDVFVSSRVNENGAVTPNILYKNNGDDTFTNISVSAQISPDQHLSFCSVFMDYNKDNWLDIYIANDKTPENLMYKNNGDGTFTEVGQETGTDIAIDAMSTTIGDYNRDGNMDIYVTNTLDGNVFYRNNGDNTFTNVAEENGTIFNSIGWGAVFLDAENDGDLDLYVSGMIVDDSQFLPSAFYENDGTGNYEIPENAGFDNDTAQSFSNAIGDINNDGYPDIVVLNYAPDNIFIWENQSSQNNNWIKVKLEGTLSNRQGIGAQIEISADGEKQYTFTNLGEGYLGQNSSYEFFGIGEGTSIDYIKVEWPSGVIDLIENPEINTALTMVEGENILSNEVPLLEDSVVLSPIPVKESLCITTNEDTVLTSIHIYDLTGSLVKEMNDIQSSCDIPLSGINSGLYILEITTTMKQKLFKKIIIE